MKKEANHIFLVTLWRPPLFTMSAGAELKFLDGFSGIHTAGVFGNIVVVSHNVVPQGTGQTQRVGRKIIVQSLSVRGSMQLPSTSTIGDMDQRLRIVFYVDTQTNGSNPIIPEMLNGDPVSIFTFRELSNLSRIKFIFDETFDMPVLAMTGGGVSAPTSTGFRFSRKLNLPIEYDATATTGALATQRTNNIGSFMISEQTDVAPTILYVWRIRYTDA